MKLGDIKTLQFEVWHNCNNGCQFCYLNGCRIISDKNQQIENIKFIRSIINSDKIKNYNAVGLIGGEFFQGQLSDNDVKTAWLDLISDIKKLYDEEKIVESWITASLMSSDLTDLFDTLNLLPKDKKILLSTSYDAYGRFKDESHKMLWLNNIKQIKQSYPNVVVHTQIIVTQTYINEIITNDSFLKDLLQFSSVDFKLPSLFRKDYSKLNPLTEKTYHDELLRTKDQFPQGFFIEDRNSFFKFLQKMVEIFGIEKIIWFCRNEVRSKTLYLLPTKQLIEDRWDENNHDENAQCGHVYDSFCYTQSNKCARCDALEYYQMLKLN